MGDIRIEGLRHPTGLLALRVALFDFWGFSTGYRVLTFFVLTLVTLALGFVYARFADRLKTLL